ncbi:MAG: hypothetical protein Q4G16_03160 [Cruoricaptor ignavus]|nr:hypothetical protein [Cruoricaptor ignavus]
MKYRLKIAALGLMIFTVSTSCNRDEEVLPDEDYTKLFPIKTPEIPYENYDDMIVYPCNPTEDELAFQYPGVEIQDNIRDYTVRLNILFTEKKGFNLEPYPNSKFEVRYIDENHKLVILRNYEHEGKPADIKNDKLLRISFKVKSGYPLYLATHGYGFNSFNIDIKMLARSDDRVISSPVLSYQKYLYADGSKDMEPFCEKVILP